MAAPEINDALYQQLVDTGKALAAPIRGLEARVEVSSSPELQTAEQAALTELRAQKTEIDRAIGIHDQYREVLDTLAAMGWPAIPTFVLPEPMYSEFQSENDDIIAGAAVFTAAPALATHFRVTEVLEPH